LRKEGMSAEDFRRHVRDQLATALLIEHEVKARIPLPGDDEIKQLYDLVDASIKEQTSEENQTEGEPGELATLAKVIQRHYAERVRARDILISLPMNASQEQRDAALAKIRDLQARLSNGEDFAELARKYSEDPVSKVRGGDLGFFMRGDMDPALENAAFALEVGQTSGIVQANSGFHLVHLDEKKVAEKITLEKLSDELRSYLLQKRTTEGLKAYLAELRSKADIKINPLMNIQP
jgi:parvulin-like peptidyl-prolyl isomerase